MTLNNLGASLSDMSHLEDAKDRYEKALIIYEKLLQNDPENVAYQFMYKHIQDLKELTFEELKKKCCSILIPAQ